MGRPQHESQKPARLERLDQTALSQRVAHVTKGSRTTPAWQCSLLLLPLIISGCIRTPPQTPPRSASQSELPGPKPDGSVLLPNQWSLRPAGEQIELRDFPINISVHPHGRF